MTWSALNIFLPRGWADIDGGSNAAFAWINRFRRLVPRYERRSDIHHAFTALACSYICFKALQGRF